MTHLYTFSVIVSKCYSYVYNTSLFRVMLYLQGIVAMALDDKYYMCVLFQNCVPKDKNSPYSRTL